MGLDILRYYQELSWAGLGIFCPEDGCADRVAQLIREANHSIDFMTFSFTHDHLGPLLALKHDEGVNIRGIMESRQVTKYSEFALLEHQGIDVRRDSNPANMHQLVHITNTLL